MFTKILTMRSTESCYSQIELLAACISEADAILIGAGAGLSVAAGFTYSGKKFRDNFGDFIEKYGFRDMYSAGFYPYETLEEYWAYWSRYIYVNRYDQPAGKPYTYLLKLMKDKDHFILTTNVDHRFQTAGFERKRLFYTQGDFGLWQCSIPCHSRTYDNEAAVRQMTALQKDMHIPSHLIPKCPVCKAPMSMNLRADSTFAEDEGWRLAAGRYQAFLARHSHSALLFLELGVGYNTPGIIKYPFWRMVQNNPKAAYVCINQEESWAPPEIAERSLCINGDISEVLDALSDTIGSFNTDSWSCAAEPDQKDI